MVLTGGKQSTRRKIFSSATFPTKYHTKTGLGLNPGRHGKRLATDRLSNGTSYLLILLVLLILFYLWFISRRYQLGLHYTE